MSLKPTDFPYSGRFSCGERIRQRASDLSRRAGADAGEQADGKLGSVAEILDYLAYFQAGAILRLDTPPTYPTALFTEAPTEAGLPHKAPGAGLWRQVSALLRSDLIRACQDMAADADRRGGTSPHAQWVFDTIELLADDLLAIKRV